MKAYAVVLLTALSANSSAAQDAAMISAAKQTLEMAQSPSFAKGVEHCGLLGQIAGARYVAGKPRPGRADSCAPRDFSGDIDVIASYHTHGSYDPDADAELPSASDVEADMAEGIFGFVSTPGGRMWMIDPDAGTATLLCDLGCLPPDPNFESDGETIRPRYTLRQLQARERGW